MFTNSHLICTAEVAVEHATPAELKALVIPLLGHRAVPGSFLHIAYDIFDATDAYQQWDEVADRFGIPEGNQFLREFDLLPFAVSFSISAQSNLLLRAAVPILAEWIARRVAVDTNRRALLTFNGGEIPYRLYQADRLVQDFAMYYELVLGRRIVSGGHKGAGLE